MKKEIIYNLLFIAQFIESSKDPKGFSEEHRERILQMREENIKLFAAYEMALKEKDPTLTHSDLLAMIVELAEEEANVSGEPLEIECNLVKLFEERGLDSFQFSEATEEDLKELSCIFFENDGRDDPCFEEVYLFEDRLFLVFDGFDRDFGFLSVETQNKISEIITKAI